VTRISAATTKVRSCPDTDPATPRKAVEDNGFDVQQAGVLAHPEPRF
jgi:hypothetical protein